MNCFFLCRGRQPEEVSSFCNKALTPDDNDEDDVDGATYSDIVHTSKLWTEEDDTALYQDHNDQAQSDDELLEKTKDRSKIGNIFKMVSMNFLVAP